MKWDKNGGGDVGAWKQALTNPPADPYLNGFFMNPRNHRQAIAFELVDKRFPHDRSQYKWRWSDAAVSTHSVRDVLSAGYKQHERPNEKHFEEMV